MHSETAELSLTALVLNDDVAMPLVPGGPERGWMHRTPDKFAYRCLPLVMANQSGWLVLSSHTVRVIWNGGASAHGLTVEVLAGAPLCPAGSHFGSGILTWTLPYLFRTPPGWNLLARGPANHIKDGIQALEGLVETDWNPATFTLNWKMTRPDFPITFEQGEPIGMLVPQRRGDLESFRPILRSLEEEPALADAVSAWAEARTRFLVESEVPGSPAHGQRRGDYLRGVFPEGTAAKDHQTKRNLRAFEGAGKSK